MWRRGWSRRRGDAADSDCAVRVAVATARWASSVQSIDAVSVAAVAVLGLEVALASGALAAASQLGNTNAFDARAIEFKVFGNTARASPLLLMLTHLALGFLDGFVLTGPVVMERWWGTSLAPPVDDPEQQCQQILAELEKTAKQNARLVRKSWYRLGAATAFLTIGVFTPATIAVAVALKVPGDRLLTGFALSTGFLVIGLFIVLGQLKWSALDPPYGHDKRL